MKRKVLLLLSLVLLLSFSAMGAAAQTNDNIVDIAAKNSNFDTLHTAVVVAGLADTLASADAQYTVFAPTDAAFGDLDPALLSAALADPKGALTTVLTYHVVAGNYSGAELLEMGTVTTLQGEELTITTRNDDVFVNDARVVIADVPAKNGIIHAIDAVLLPAAVTGGADTAATTETTAAAADTAGDTASKTIAEIAVEAGNFTSLVGALQATGLVATFTMPGNYTVFAPTDDAFAALGDIDLSEDELKAILLYHVVNDRLTRDQLATDDLVPTLSDGRPLFINRSGSRIIDVSGAKLVVTDIQASNGIIHVIDRVMIP
jgi:uncharacterized surface protein with fasciclin (FAS1) repeats